MCAAVFLECFYCLGKLNQPARVETIGSEIESSKRLHIRDRDSGLVFLIDTGSDITLLPADKRTINNRPNDLILFAANNSRVLTYGTKRLSLNLNLRRKFSWNFGVAAVPNPIIEADLLAYYHLVPYLHKSRLVATTTGLGAVGFLKFCSCFQRQLNRSFGSLVRDSIVIPGDYWLFSDLKNEGL